METHQDSDHDARFGKAIAKGAAIGVPVVLIALTLGVWLLTDNDLGDSFATSLLPGVLLGVFGGGFAGMTTVME